jgi:hypothetical protein
MERLVKRPQGHQIDIEQNPSQPQDIRLIEQMKLQMQKM